MTDYEIIEAITAKYKQFAAINGTPIALPGEAFEPTTPLWLELDIAPNNFDDTLSDQYAYKRGVITLSCCCRKGASQYEYSRAVFGASVTVEENPKGTVIHQSVVVSKTPMMLSKIEYQDRIMIPVSIEYSE